MDDVSHVHGGALYASSLRCIMVTFSVPTAYKNGATNSQLCTAELHLGSSLRVRRPLSSTNTPHSSKQIRSSKGLVLTRTIAFGAEWLFMAAATVGSSMAKVSRAPDGKFTLRGFSPARNRYLDVSSNELGGLSIVSERAILNSVLDASKRKTKTRRPHATTAHGPSVTSLEIVCKYEQFSFISSYQKLTYLFI